MGEAAREPAIGYYAHHHGAGHVTRALAIARHLPGSMTLFGSNLPDERPHANVDYCPLPVDVDEHTVVESFTALHYAPLAVAGLRERMGALVDWFREAWPCLLVVDVSVEVALLARLCGVPTIYVRQHGERFRCRSFARLRLRDAFAGALSDEFRRTRLCPKAGWQKTDYTGLISRYERTDGASPRSKTNASRRDRDLRARWHRLHRRPSRRRWRARVRDWQWTVAGPIWSPIQTPSPYRPIYVCLV